MKPILLIFAIAACFTVTACNELAQYSGIAFTKPTCEPIDMDQLGMLGIWLGYQPYGHFDGLKALRLAKSSQFEELYGKHTYSLVFWNPANSEFEDDSFYDPNNESTSYNMGAIQLCKKDPNDASAEIFKESYPFILGTIQGWGAFGWAPVKLKINNMTLEGVGASYDGELMSKAVEKYPDIKIKKLKTGKMGHEYTKLVAAEGSPGSVRDIVRNYVSYSEPQMRNFVSGRLVKSCRELKLMADVVSDENIGSNHDWGSWQPNCKN